MGTIAVDQGGNPWKFSATGGALAVPVLVCQYDFIPKRLRWEPDTTTKAGDTVLVNDVQGRTIMKFVAQGAYFEEIDTNPRLLEKWIGYYNPAVVPGPPANTDLPSTPGITLKQLDSGIWYLYY
jgi:hypothetical protein